MKPLILILSFISLLFANLPPQITYNENHQPLVVEYEDGSVTEFDYGTQGRLKTQTNPSGDTITYSYDGVGNITQIETPTQTITKTYDALNRLATVTDSQGTVSYEYDAIGRQTQVTFANGVTSHYTYDSRSRITSIVHKSSDGTVLQSFTYTLDAVGNRTSIVELSGRTTEYEYNEVNQLSKEVVSNDPNGVNTTTTFAYDDVGNLLTKTIDGIDTSYTYNANDQLTQQGSKTFTYDANGNMVSDGTNSYSYDDKNRLISLTTPTQTVEYSYDANDNRIAKTTSNGTTTYLVDANTPYAQVITETKENGTQIEYTYGNDLLNQNTDAQTLTYLTDALGSTRALADSAGNITDNYTYTPYGALLEHIGSSSNAFMFAGEQYGFESGNYYLRARYYNPASARFLTRDSYDGRMNSPITQNHYLYTGSNPIRYTDPDGHFFGGVMSIGMSLMTTIASGYPRIAGTTERGMVVALYAKTLVVGLEMRNEALNSIIASILVGGLSQKDVNYAYDKYNQATKILNMVSGTAYETYDVFSYMQAGLGFAKGLTKLPTAKYSSVPFTYLSKTNSLNSKIAIGLKKVIRDRSGFEDVMEALKDMTDLMRRFVTSSPH